MNRRDLLIGASGASAALLAPRAAAAAEPADLPPLAAAARAAYIYATPYQSFLRMLHRLKAAMCVRA